MALFGFLISSSSHPAGVVLDLFERELDDAWSGAISFTTTISAATWNKYGGVTVGNVEITTVETPDSSQETAMNNAIANNSQTYTVEWQIDNGPLPLNPTVGQTIYLSNIQREGGGTGALAWWDGTDWRRVSDNAVATASV